MRRAQTFARALAVAGAAALALAAGGLPAGAHEGDGIITVEAVHPAGTSAHLIVLVTWENDGHPAADATVTATPVRADGSTLTPVSLAPSGAGDGRYSGNVELPEPGEWTIRLTSIEPTGTAETTYQAAAPAPAPAPGGDSGDGGSAAPTTAPDGQFAPADDGTGDSTGDAVDVAADGEAADDGGSGIPVAVVLVAAIVAIGGAVAAIGVVRRNRPAAGDGSLLAPGEPRQAGGAASDAGDAGQTATGTGPGGGSPGEPGPAQPDAPGVESRPR